MAWLAHEDLRDNLHRSAFVHEALACGIHEQRTRHRNGPFDEVNHRAHGCFRDKRACCLRHGNAVARVAGGLNGAFDCEYLLVYPGDVLVHHLAVSVETARGQDGALVGHVTDVLSVFVLGDYRDDATRVVFVKLDACAIVNEIRAFVGCVFREYVIGGLPRRFVIEVRGSFRAHLVAEVKFATC